MIFRNVIFQLEVIKQRLPAGLVSHHEQASKRNREQQHRVLWPAYNPNLAARQASTEGLFQQTRLIAEIEPLFGNYFESGLPKSRACVFAHAPKINLSTPTS